MKKKEAKPNKYTLFFIIYYYYYYFGNLVIDELKFIPI